MPLPVAQTVPGPQKKPSGPETVNLDTGTIIAASSLGNPWLATALHAYLADKKMVVTQAVLTEFLTGSLNIAGPTEKTLAALFLMRVTVIPNDPSARVMALKAPSKTKQQRLGPVDRIAFGTGDKLGIKTLTGDDKFPKEAARQGVHLDVLVHAPGRYVGQ